MKKQLITYAIAMLLATTAMASVSLACEQGKDGSYKKQHAKSSHHRIPGKSLAYLRMVVKNANLLGLSEKQQEKVSKLLLKAEADVATIHTKAKAVVSAFRSILHSGKASAKDVRAYSKQMGELRTKSLAARLLPSIQVKSILSAEQREKLKTLHRKSRDKSRSIKTKQCNTGSRT